MKIDVIRPCELDDRDLALWRQMQRATPALANPFLCPEFTVAVGRVKEGARVAVVREGGEVAAIFPFERRRLGIGMPIGAGVSDAQGVVHRLGFEWDPAELLRDCGLSSSNSITSRLGKPRSSIVCSDQTGRIADRRSHRRLRGLPGATGGAVRDPEVGAQAGIHRRSLQQPDSVRM
jgi:hypothetical protein